MAALEASLQRAGGDEQAEDAAEVPAEEAPKRKRVPRKKSA